MLPGRTTDRERSLRMCRGFFEAMRVQLSAGEIDDHLEAPRQLGV